MVELLQRFITTVYSFTALMVELPQRFVAPWLRWPNYYSGFRVSRHLQSGALIHYIGDESHFHRLLEF